MRTIPSELLNRVKKKWQVPAENADPRMKIYLSRGFLNEFFEVFTIQNAGDDESLSDVDVAVRRTETGDLPSEVFALAIKDGQAQVKSKPLPYDDQTPWIHHFTIAAFVTSVAIEFDGYWVRDPNKIRYNLITDDYPWIFYVQSGILYAQHWDDDPIELATGVSEISTLRGWKNTVHWEKDQGLIVAYIKSGTVYYRSYCQQDGGLPPMWENEREIEEWSGVDNISMFRTNDYRMGFVAEMDGDIEWLITDRNWANMAIPPEFISVSPASISIDLTWLEYLDAFMPSEYVSAMPNLYFDFGHIYTTNGFIEIYNTPVMVDDEEDWGKELIFKVQQTLFSPSAGDFTIVSAKNKTFIPNEIEKLDHQIYKLKYLGVNNFNNAGETATLKFLGGAENIVGDEYDPFEKSFNPLNLIPTEAPVPEVEEVWNE